MAWFSQGDRQLAQVVSDVAHCNPFAAERLELERAILGEAFETTSADLETLSGNVAKISAVATRLLDAAHKQAKQGKKPTPHEIDLHEDIALWVLYHRYRDDITGVIERAMRAAPGDGRRKQGHKFSRWTAFARDAHDLLTIPGGRANDEANHAHALAIFFQIRRAFFHVYRNIIGHSQPIVRLRAAVWQSIFTHDLRRYRRGLFPRMADFTTLIVGPSGTGKELVAQAIGVSRYIPFDPQNGRFTEDFAGSFTALNLSSLSQTLIESELFGHKRGAFTDAQSDRAGYLESCPPLGTVFLDEIGELDPAIQVKLLRVLQMRTFQRIGDETPRRFAGKIIGATNRDLRHAIGNGLFREDFYYRLCSDVIHTPSLREQMEDDPQTLVELVQYLAQRIVGDDAPAVTQEVVAWVGQHMGADYAWRGNVRELEQCVRNIVIRGEYQPPCNSTGDTLQQLLRGMTDGQLSADELLDQYITLVYHQTGNYMQAAELLGMDRRTVKTRVEKQAASQSG